MANYGSSKISSPSGSAPSEFGSQPSAPGSQPSSGGPPGPPGPGSSGSNPASSSAAVLNYFVVAIVEVVYTEGWSVLYMLDGSASTGYTIHEDGESSGGLSCVWQTPAPNTHESSISGLFTSADSFTFNFWSNEVETLSITRLVRVTNFGDSDILVNGSSLSGGGSFVNILVNSESAPWDSVGVTVTVTEP